MPTDFLPRPYLGFPFRIAREGPLTSDRRAHVREQIWQVLLTDPGERVFRPDFGAGAQTLVFEPKGSALWMMAQKRLEASLVAALQGEVDPKSIRVEIGEAEDGANRTGGPGENGEGVVIIVSYTLATVGQRESLRFSLGKR